MKSIRERSFNDCPLSEKLFYTAFLLVMGISYLMALVYLYMSHEGHDGKRGVSVEDIVHTYYGNRSGTRLEAEIRGPMRAFIQQPEDSHQIVAWLRSGAAERQYRTDIRPILERSCLQCHSPAAGMNLSDLSTFAGIRAVTQVDSGKSLQSLVKLSHIHLFGISLAAFAIGLVFRLVVLRSWLKATLMVLPFLAIFVDILAWFLTRWDPFYAYTVLIAGALLGLAWSAQIVTSLYQLCFFRVRGGEKPLPERST